MHWNVHYSLQAHARNDGQLVVEFGSLQDEIVERESNIEAVAEKLQVQIHTLSKFLKSVAERRPAGLCEESLFCASARLDQYT